MNLQTFTQNRFHTIFVCVIVSGHKMLKPNKGNDSNLLIVFYVQIMPDDFVMQLHRF
ncbi:pilus assembly protein [[Kluyvera] intestini]|nr:pilus assembly protein [[Kluyvera] intestini]